MSDILFWNDVAIETIRIDYSPAKTDDPLNPEQGGPTRASRALAMIHLAMYDAFAGAMPSESTYLTYAARPDNHSPYFHKAALATAASRTAAALYPRQRASLLATASLFIQALSGSRASINEGIAWGATVADAILKDRHNDGSEVADDTYLPGQAAGFHRRDPIDFTQGFLGPYWGAVKPFGIDQLVTKVPMSPPPGLASPEYAKDYDDVKKVGSQNSASRTPRQTTIGLFWAYDGARQLGVPPRLYNQVVQAIVRKRRLTELQLVKLFAIVNVAMADAGIHAWAEKYEYEVWRPILGIRESDPGWGPTGTGDGNAATEGDPYWIPLGAPRSNETRPAFTPAFPAYPSGHATFGTAALEAVKTFLHLDGKEGFEFVSDELNGTTFGTTGVRSRYLFQGTIDQAIDDNARSRVYLGVHWQFDAVEGVKNGKVIGATIARNFPARG